MSPLRGWMQAHGRPAWWSWIVVVLVPIMASMAVLVITLRVNERTVETSIARERSAREETERAFCSIVVLLDDADKKGGEPTTGYGRELAQAIRDARNAYRCD